MTMIYERELPWSSLNLATAIAFVRELTTTRHIVVAGCTILWYDWLITLGDEIALIWPAKSSPTKVIFLANRYGNLALQLSMVFHFTGIVRVDSQQTCIWYILGYGIAVFVSLASSHYLVITRAWVIWNRRPWITLILATAYAAYCIICIALIIHATITGAKQFIISFDGSCLSFTSPSLLYVWIASLMLEYISFVTTIASISHHYSGINPGFRNLFPLPRRIYTSALVYIAISTLCHVSNMLMWGVYATRPLNMLAVTFNYCLLNVLAQRVVLDFRQLHTKGLLVIRPLPPRLSSIELSSLVTEAGTHGTEMTILRPRIQTNC